MPTHAPAWHTLPGSHFSPQAPQCSVEPSVEVSQPSVTSLLQFPNPGLQAPSLQTPFEQLEVAFVKPLHVVPQAPQCSSLAKTSVSQPFVRSPSQSPQPVSHFITHAPSAHHGPPLGPLAHGPHAAVPQP